MDGRRYGALLVLVMLLCVSGPAAQAADDSGTAAEAKAMIERAVAALKADEAAALAAFNAGEKDFKDRDLYVFCADDSTGLFSAHGADPSHVGKTNARELVDANGKPVGEEITQAAKEDEFNLVDYVWPRPGESEPSPKATYVTRVGDQVCGTGYYK